VAHVEDQLVVFGLALTFRSFAFLLAHLLVLLSRVIVHVIVGQHHQLLHLHHLLIIIHSPRLLHRILTVQLTDVLLQTVDYEPTHPRVRFTSWFHLSSEHPGFTGRSLLDESLLENRLSQSPVLVLDGFFL
jgi:hypothetical protein